MTIYTPSHKFETYFREVDLPKSVQDVHRETDFELVAYKFNCAEEQLRKSRVIKVGLFQHKIPLPTWSPIQDMLEVMFKMAAEVLEVASKSGVNVFCFQEAWSNICLS